MSFTSGSPSASVWRIADLRTLVVARSLSVLGDEAALVALVLRVHDGGRSSWAISGLLMAGILPLVLFAPAAGLAVDRVDSRALLLTVTLAQAAVCAVLAFAGPLAAVMGLVAVLGTGQAITGALYQALLPAIVGADRLPAALGFSQTSSALAGIAAPALGGLLTGLFGTRIPLLVDAGTFLALSAAALLIQTRRATGNAPREHTRMRAGFTFLLRDRLLRPLVASLIAFVLLAGAVNVVEVFLVRDTLHASTTWYGALGAVWAVGLIAGSVTAGRLRDGAALTRASQLAGTILAAALLGFPLAPSVGWLVPVALAGGAGNGALNLTVSALIMGRAPEAIRGRVAAAMGGAANAATLGSLLLGGALAAVLPPRTVFAMSGVAGLTVVAIGAPRILRSSTTETHEERGLDVATVSPHSSANPTGAHGLHPEPQ